MSPGQGSRRPTWGVGTDGSGSSKELGLGRGRGLRAPSKLAELGRPKPQERMEVYPAGFGGLTLSGPHLCLGQQAYRRGNLAVPQESWGMGEGSAQTGVPRASWWPWRGLQSPAGCAVSTENQSLGGGVRGGPLNACCSVLGRPFTRPAQGCPWGHTTGRVTALLPGRC